MFLWLLIMVNCIIKKKPIEYAKKAVALDSKYQKAAEEFIRLIQNEEWDKIPD